MPSPFGKHLFPVTISAANDTFCFDFGGPEFVTIPSAVYPTILEVLEELEIALQVIEPTFSVTVSPVGIVTISCGDDWREDWSNTDKPLRALLGMNDGSDGPEVPGSNTLVAPLQHERGWYPGTLSYGRRRDDGIGCPSDSRWQPKQDVIRNRAGNRRTSAVSSGVVLYERTLFYNWVKDHELIDPTWGLEAFVIATATSPWRWYPDRDRGTVADFGDEGTDWYEVALIESPEIDEGTASPDLFSVRLTLNLESVPEGIILID